MEGCRCRIQKEPDEAFTFFIILHSNPVPGVGTVHPFIYTTAPMTQYDLLSIALPSWHVILGARFRVLYHGIERQAEIKFLNPRKSRRFD